MSRVKQVVLASLGLALLAVLAGGAYALLTGLLRVLGNLQSQVAAAIVAASATVVVAVASILIGKSRELRLAVVQSIREKKIPVYEEMIEVVFRFMFQDRSKSLRMTEEQQFLALNKLTQRCIVWGSDDIVCAFGQFRTSLVTGATAGKDAPASLFQFEDLMLAIRRDLGHSNTNIKRGDLLRFFINDIDKYLAP